MPRSVEPATHSSRSIFSKPDGQRSARGAAEAQLAEGIAGVDPERLHCFLDWRLARGYITAAAASYCRIVLGRKPAAETEAIRATL